jgi:hypothetical protein
VRHLEHHLFLGISESPVALGPPFRAPSVGDVEIERTLLTERQRGPRTVPPSFGGTPRSRFARNQSALEDLDERNAILRPFFEQLGSVTLLRDPEKNFGVAFTEIEKQLEAVPAAARAILAPAEAHPGASYRFRGSFNWILFRAVANGHEAHPLGGCLDERPSGSLPHRIETRAAMGKNKEALLRAQFQNGRAVSSLQQEALGSRALETRHGEVETLALGGGDGRDHGLKPHWMR